MIKNAPYVMMKKNNLHSFFTHILVHFIHMLIADIWFNLKVLKMLKVNIPGPSKIIIEA